MKNTQYQPYYIYIKQVECATNILVNNIKKQILIYGYFLNRKNWLNKEFLGPKVLILYRNETNLMLF